MYTKDRVRFLRTRKTARVSIQGEFDIALTKPVLDAGRKAISTAGTTELIVDLGRATFMDTSGVDVLLQLRNEARARNIGFKAVNARETARLVLRLTGTSRLLAAG